MYCISYNLYKYIQRLFLHVFGRKMEEESGGGWFLLHRCTVKRWVWKFRERVGSFFHVCFSCVCGREKKWLFVHKWSSFACGSAEEDILDVVASAAGRKCSSSSCSEDERNLPPPPPVEVSAPQSSQVC